jgi:hypothetical protein
MWTERGRLEYPQLLAIVFHDRRHVCVLPAGFVDKRA